MFSITAMALLANMLHTSLEDELGRLEDQHSRYLASKRLLERFLRSLPLGCALSTAFVQLDSSISQLRQSCLALNKNAESVAKETHGSSTTYLINRRRAEIEDKVKKYCQDKINEINLSEKAAPKVVTEKRVTVRAGIANVPHLVKVLDVKSATSDSTMAEMLRNINHEVAIKEKIKADLLANHVTNERIEQLREGNLRLENELKVQKEKLRIWKISKLVHNFLSTMNKPERIVKKCQTINMFLAGVGEEEDLGDQSDVAVSDPSDSQRAQNALELIKDFGEFIKNRQFHEAAQLAAANSILQSLHSFNRIAGTG